MIKTALWELQKAVVTRLEADTVLMGLITGVFDEVPEGTPLPYVQIGDDTVNPYDTKTTSGEDLTLTLHTYARPPGKREAKLIMDAVLQAITREHLVIPGCEVEGIRREFLEVYEDGKAYHGICRFRVYVKQI